MKLNFELKIASKSKNAFSATYGIKTRILYIGLFLLKIDPNFFENELGC